MQHVREAIVTFDGKDTPTTPPVLLTTKPVPSIAFGTKQGKLMILTLPFADGKSVTAHAQSLSLEEEEKLTVSSLFMDLEYAPAIITLVKDESLYALTRGGVLWALRKTKRRIAVFEREAQGLAHTPEGFLIPLGTRLVLVNKQGKVLDTLQLEHEALASPLWIDEQGLAVIPTEGGVEAVSIFKGVLVRKWSYQSAAVHATPAAKRVREGMLLITFGSHDGIIHAVTSQGDLVWQYRTQGSILAPPRMEDLNGDGVIDIAIGSTDDTFYVIDEYGVREWSFEADFWITARAAVYDINQDGLREVFVGAYDGKLYTFSPQPDFVPAVNVAAASMLQQALLVEEEAHESVAGYFAKLLATDEIGGMILFTEAFPLDETSGMVIALSHTGRVFAKRFRLTR